MSLCVASLFIRALVHDPITHKAKVGTKRKWGASGHCVLEEAEARVAADVEIGVDLMPCVVNEPDFRRNLWKERGYRDMELDKFEAVNPDVWADKIDVKLGNITVVEEGEVSRLHPLLGFRLERKNLSSRFIRIFFHRC